ncbi:MULTISPECIES: hypothetical protein [Mycolicibacter]|uniref:Uncharacterized protein n=2 Tax=Mycolicibacter TaxID=1073531 RepID=A0ABU5XNV8_9MYCO|nr:MULTISPECIES: hypothetical protein [unclassified Mycolicibacter]MEB3022982.1 hypothetical protein [Mycolicibacter sp. MYC098]MEB3033492.1 hypothetical protein [Mycolicibacter sp. MYC340]
MDGNVVAVAPNGQVFTHSALLRNHYVTRNAVLVSQDGVCKALSWHVDSFAADRKAFSKKVREAYDAVIVVDVEAAE